MSTETIPVFQSKWGYHAIDYPTFVEVKCLHKLAFRDMQAGCRLDRWRAKLPHNRVRRKTKEPIPEPQWCGTTRSYYDRVLACYRAARYPETTAEAVRPFQPPDNWRGWLVELEAFYATG